eukprot:scaffold17568_cov35-Attheya_sp.AAC.1
MSYQYRRATGRGSSRYNTAAGTFSYHAGTKIVPAAGTVLVHTVVYARKWRLLLITALVLYGRVMCFP